MKRVLRRVLQTTVGLMATIVLGGVAAPTAVADTVQGSYLVGGAQPSAGVPFFGAGSKAQADGAWDYYQKTIGQPMSDWAKTEVRRAPGGTVFYPFSGPDFVTVSHLFPQADRFVMVAMQAAGEPAAVQPEAAG